MTDRPKTLEERAREWLHEGLGHFPGDPPDCTQCDQTASLTALLRSVSEEAERRGMEEMRSACIARLARCQDAPWRDAACAHDVLRHVEAEIKRTPPPGGEEPREGSSLDNQPGGATDSEPRPSAPPTQAGGRGDS